MTRSTDVAVADQAPALDENKERSIGRAVAHRYGMEPRAFINAVRSTWPTDVRDKITVEQIAAFLVVCDQYKLNPLTKEIYAFPSKGGAIVPMLGIDGWITIANSHPEFDGQEWTDRIDEKGKLIAVDCTIWRKDRSRPTTVREYLSECIRDTIPWKQTPARMLRHRAFMQCARYAFGFTALAIEGDVIDGEVLEITPQAGDVVGQVVPSARDLALQAEDDSIKASAARAAAARAAQQQTQAKAAGADPQTGEVVDNGEGSAGDDEDSGDDSDDGAGDDAAVDDGAPGGRDDDARWNIVDDIINELKSKTTVMDFNSAHSRRKQDIEALEDEMQAEIGKEVAAIMLKLKGNK